ncbi:hypothetical protein CP982_15085 [Streptomyces spectabilis]|uniref:Uncharacterized protein n=1 Tax=Streptomyces spectabilis TaxID=68270 RepID=A0A5P2X625_STRST|nr:hypothetical protein CP982_15085 [Streptomyces spectabilis]
MGIFVFRHGSRLLEDAAALTARNIPRSKASGYVHLWVMRSQPPVCQQIESNARVMILTGVSSPLEVISAQRDVSPSP